MFFTFMNTDEQTQTCFDHGNNYLCQGNYEQAITCYQKALDLNSDCAQILYNLAVAFHKQNRIHEAIEHYWLALRKNPDLAQAHFNLADAYAKLNRTKEACDAYLEALRIEPHNAQAAYNLGNEYQSQKENPKALRAYQYVLSINPAHVQALNNMGMILRETHPEQALNILRQACRLEPDFANAWYNLAETCLVLKNPDEAERYYKKAIALAPTMEIFHNNLGNAYRNQKRYNEAIDCYRKVIELKPELAEGYYNLGSVFQLNEDFGQALKYLKYAIELRSDYTEAWNNMGLACKNIGELDRAMTCFTRALSIDPNFATAYWNRSFVYLLKRSYRQGWKDFEWRFKIPIANTLYPFRLKGKRWQGQDAPGTRILVHDEQGIGDTLQFVRYLPLVKRRCESVIFETRPELIDLFKCLIGVDKIVPRPKQKPTSQPYDYYVPLLSLPKIFATTPETIPGVVPYIFADPEKIEAWRSQLPGSGYKIGLVWAGRPEHTNDHNRSCPLKTLLPLLKMKNVAFVSLQTGPAVKQIRTLPESIRPIEIGTRLKDFADTAGVVHQLDLLISVDTAVAHLAGAMGKLVWMLVPFIPDWRWTMRGKNTIWYPGMRLFRQNTPKLWDDVILSIISNLSVTQGSHQLQNTLQLERDN
ncbi:MAG: tetratricopeptide repeat protein [Desulfobacteraceae bacterium]|nr:tetratricopeptide repeat protein [Desulfobacteraceae bacterium]